MAQKQFITYQADVLSFDAREAMLGVLRAGRYSGYSEMSSNGTPSGGNIPVLLTHSSGVQKLPKGLSALSNPIGVMVTTQGVIIHEDQNIGVTVTDNNAGGSIKYSLVYLEHEYLDGVSGPNPGTYGVINGTAGSGIPSLTLSYKRSIVGVIKMDPGATTVAGLTWIPRSSDNVFGDSKTLQKLFGSTADLDSTIMGLVPSGGIIGTRQYTEENYIISEESITDSLDELDIQLKLTDDIVTEIYDRSIDSADWADLTDNTNQNVSIAHHGLVPKLPNDETKFFNGIGAWAAFPASLLAENNLGDVADPAIARSNLGVISAAEIEANYFEDTGWLTMSRGVAANSANFDMKIRRIGNICHVQGTFRDGGNTSPNAEIAFILLSTLAGSSPTWKSCDQKTYFTAGVYIADAQTNRGLHGYVAKYVTNANSLSLLIDNSSGLGGSGDAKFNVNFTFFVSPVDDI